MDIKTLKNFITIAENGSICRAAKELHMSQPPLSKQIKLLEEELNVQLFDRSSRGVELTSEGRLLYTHATSLVAYNDLIMRELMDTGSETIRLGMITSSVQYSLNLIKSFYEDKPIHFEITEKNSFELLNLLENNIIDLAFIRTPFDMNKPFDYIKLTNDHLVAVGRPDFFEREGGAITLPELAELPLITVRRWKKYIDMNMSSFREAIGYKFICDDNRTSLLMAMNGMGVSILPDSIVTEDLPQEIIRKKWIEGGTFRTSIYVVYNPSRTFNKYTDEFLRFLLGKNIESDES